MNESSFEKIRRFFEEKKRMPTYREIRDGILHISSMKQTKRFIDRLVDDGLLDRDTTGKLLPTRHFFGVRTLGFVEAGFPSPAEEELLDTMTLDEWLIGNREATFMLEVKGESMRDAGIRPGDAVLVERGREPKNGDIVIAEVDHKWTMKYYKKNRQGISLVPANPAFDIILPKEELRIEAIVTAVIRKY
jgi:SOS regulatory protein LexA